jgi:hypothetical protein
MKGFDLIYNLIIKGKLSDKFKLNFFFFKYKLFTRFFNFKSIKIIKIDL